MALQRPTMLNSAIAWNGDKTSIPATAADAGTGRLSIEKGWGPVNSLPIADGGVPPYREDFNGAFWLVSQLLVYLEHGGWFAYNSSMDYLKGAEVFDSQWAVKYRALQNSGPNYGGAKALTNTAYWKKVDRSGVPAGTIACFANVTLGTGTYAKNPKFWGESDPDPTWVLADGSSYTINGSTFATPDLRSKFIYGATTVGGSSGTRQGTTGGAASVTSGSTTVSGTVANTTLTANQIPGHTHSVTVTISGHTHNIASTQGAHTHEASTFSSAGNHSHSGNTLNATGSFLIDDVVGSAPNVATGVFSRGAKQSGTSKSGSVGNGLYPINFSLSGEWSGATSTTGSHTHSISSSGTHGHTMTTAGAYSGTITSTSVGGGQAHTHGFSSSGHTHTVATLPPFYRMAFFVKLPEV